MRLPFINKPPARSRKQRDSGFTLIEMLVVAPLALFVIAGLVTAMVAMVTDALVTNTRSTTIYNLQDTLDRIEQDTRVGVNFMDTYTLLTSPQGRGGGTTPYTSAGGDLIITQQATTDNPSAGSRSLVYYANQPASCSSGTELNGNRKLTSRIIYYLSGGTLWRHTQVPTNNQNGTLDAGTSDYNTTCQRPWQRTSCNPSNALGPNCKTYDERMIDNVSSFTVTYYDEAGVTTSDPTAAYSVSTAITTDQKAANKQISQTSTVRVTRINDIPATPAPLTPSITQYNSSDNNFNNPRLVTFQWSSTYAMVYSVQTQVNGGGWSAAQTTSDTTFGVPVPSPGSTVDIRVTAYNDYGTSAMATKTISSPYRSDCELQNGWTNYGSPYGPATFTKTSSDIVMMHGLIRYGTAVQNETICVLPEGFRPDKRLIFQTQISGATTSRIDVDTDGTVILIYGNTSWMSLDQISFVASGAYTWSSALTGQNSWTNYGSVYSNVVVTTDSVGRKHMQGLAKAGSTTNGANMFTLPSGYAPPTYDIFPGRCSVGSAVQLYNGYLAARGIPCNGYLSTQIMWWVTTSGWNNLTLGAGWVHYGGTWSTAQYKKGSDNIVSLHGLIKSGTATAGTVIATLPSGYRPLENLICTTSTYDATENTAAGARLDVNSNGQLVIREGVLTNWVSLAGCNFYADGS